MIIKHENLCDAVEPMIRGKFLSVNAYIRKEYSLKWISLNFKKPEKKDMDQAEKKEITNRNQWNWKWKTNGEKSMKQKSGSLKRSIKLINKKQN